MRANKAIAAALKQRRIELHMSVEDVINALADRGVHLKPVTLYGYENAVSSPNAQTFLYLCAIYHIDDIVNYFGYGDD